jgi:hypothetical protein
VNFLHVPVTNIDAIGGSDLFARGYTSRPEIPTIDNSKKVRMLYFLTSEKRDEFQ